MTTTFNGSTPGLFRTSTAQSVLQTAHGPIPLPIPPTPTEVTVTDDDNTEAKHVVFDKKSEKDDIESLNSSAQSETNAFVYPDGHTYPEGGLRAWGVVLGAFFAMIAALGIMNTIGVFQAYLATHQLASYPASTIGWIFSVYTFMAFFCGIQIGPVFDAKGPRLLVLAGSILVVGSIMLTSISTAYWHFMLAFGVMGGIGCSLLFTPAIAAIGHFFMAKRGAATGLGIMGGSLGGVIFPLMLQSLLPKLGWGWSLRILGFISIVLCVLANLLIRSRLPPKEGSSVLPDYRVFKDLSFTFLTIGTYFMEWGLFVPIAYISSYALSTGVVEESLSYQLLAILNAGSCLGRYLPGLFADKVGRFNTMIITLALCGVLTLTLWLPATIFPLVNEQGTATSATKPILITYALLFGFASGSNLSLTPVCVGQLCDTQQYGRYYATCYSVVAVGTLTGIPIAGSILQACNGSYWGVAVWTGACYMISVSAYLESRRRRAGGLFKWAKI